MTTWRVKVVQVVKVYFLGYRYTFRGRTTKATSWCIKNWQGGIVARIGLQKGIKKADPKRYPFLFFKLGRIDWTRTSDLFDPNEAFYQAELQSDIADMFITKKN